VICKSVKSRCEFCGCCLLSQGTILSASSLYNRRHSWQHCPPHLKAEFIYLPLWFQCIKGNDYLAQYSTFILKSECIFLKKKSYWESLPCIDYSHKRGELPTVVTDHSQSSLLTCMVPISLVLLYVSLARSQGIFIPGPQELLIPVLKFCANDDWWLQNWEQLKDIALICYIIQ